jgi:hypothetical protein
MTAYLPLDLIVDEHSGDVSLSARFRRELDIQSLTKGNNSAANLTEAISLGNIGASPFGSRMPKGNPVDLISAEAD